MDQTKGEERRAIREKEDRRTGILLGLICMGAGALLVIINSGIFGFELLIAGFIGVQWVGWPTILMGLFIIWSAFWKKPKQRGLR